MKIEMIEPDHRCKKCNTPLNFLHNYFRTDEEIQERFERRMKKASWFKKMFMGYDRWSIDNQRQYWECPKCRESYLVDNRVKCICNVVPCECKHGVYRKNGVAYYKGIRVKK